MTQHIYTLTRDGGPLLASSDPVFLCKHFYELAEEGTVRSPPLQQERMSLLAAKLALSDGYELLATVTHPQTNARELIRADRVPLDGVS